MLAISSDNIVTVSGLFDVVTSSFLNDATVAGAILNSAGSTVATFSLSYISGTNGNYRGTITAAVSATLTAGTTYTLQVTATSTSGVVLVDRDSHVANYA